jgi:hypothetical protein
MKATRRFLRKILLCLTVLLTAVMMVFTAIGQAATTLVWVAGTQAPYYQYPDQDPNDLGKNGLTDPIFDGVDQNVGVQYDRTMGLITYPGAPLYDDSVAGGRNNAYIKIVEVRNSDPTGTIILTCVSQGCDATWQAVRQLEADGFDTSNMVVILQGNPASTLGGIKTALPFGYVPLLGMTLGQGTSTTVTPITQVRNQYDLATDMPQYFNLLALANVLAGFLVDHTHEYNGPLNDPSHIVTTSQSGLVTDVFIPHEGIVPLLRPLAMLGVSMALLEVINQPLKDLIELGYDRSNYGVPGTYPDEPVRMSLVPPSHLLIPGLAKFVTDSLVAVQQLVAMVVPPAPNPALVGSSLTERSVSPMSVSTVAEVSEPEVQVKSEPPQHESVSQNDSSTPTPPTIQSDKPEQSKPAKPSIGVDSTEPRPAEQDSPLEKSGKLDKEEPKEPEEKESKSTPDLKVFTDGNKFRPGDTVQEPSINVKDNDPVPSLEPDVSIPTDNSQSTGMSVGSDNPDSSSTSTSGTSDGNQSNNTGAA